MEIISRAAAIELADKLKDNLPDDERMDDAVIAHNEGILEYQTALSLLPSVQPERDTPKRVSWTGWKGHRYTRYNCPNCKKPVRNDDVYCHRCGQRLMFPKVSHTPYIEGQKQEVIVRWDDGFDKP